MQNLGDRIDAIRDRFQSRPSESLRASELLKQLSEGAGKQEEAGIGLVLEAAEGGTANTHTYNTLPYCIPSLWPMATHGNTLARSHEILTKFFTQMRALTTLALSTISCPGALRFSAA